MRDTTALLISALQGDKLARKALADVIEEAGEIELAGQIRRGDLILDRIDWRTRRIYYDPKAIRAHFEYDERVQKATDEELNEVADYALDSDSIWEEFDRGLMLGCNEVLGFFPSDYEEEEENKE